MPGSDGASKRGGALRGHGERRRDPHVQSAGAPQHLGARHRRRVLRAIDRAEADPAIRVIVLTGRGKGFCAGAYLGAPSSAPTYGETMERAAKTNLADLVGERPPHFVTTLRKPVIAAINGACVGIGLTQALMCDVRFAAAGAKFAAVVRAPRTDRRVRHLLDTCRG